MILSDISLPEIFGDNEAHGGELLQGEGAHLLGVVDDDNGVLQDLTDWTLSVAAEAYMADGANVRGLSNFVLMDPQPTLPVSFGKDPSRMGGSELTIPTTIFSNINIPVNAAEDLPVLVMYLKHVDGPTVHINRLAVLYRRGK